MKRKSLLTTNNHKTIKSLNFNEENSGLPYLTYILYMSPYNFNSKGINVCSHASKGCAESCLVGSGRGSLSNVQKGRLRKTEEFLSDRIGFLYQLKSEIETAIKKNKDKAIVTIRLNGTSDLVYEKYRVFEGDKNIFEVFSDVMFYDYTKNYKRFDNELPSNYHLTFSRSETNDKKAMELLERGFNVAIVFSELPETYNGYVVIDGDESDLRINDPKNVIVGLKYKKMTGSGADNKKAIESGFVIDTKQLELV